MILGREGLVLKVGADLSRFDRAMSKMRSRVSGLGRTLSKPFKMATLAVTGFTAALGAAIVALGTGGVIAAAKFEKALAEVRTILDKSRWDMSRVQYDVGKLSRDIGANLIDTTKGLYQVVSAGFNEHSTALEVLRQSMKLGVAGLSSTEQAVDAVTTALNAYGLEAADSEYVSDLLFTTVKLGKTRMEELAGSVGRVLPVASQLGVSLEETFGALAVLTQQGLRTEEAVTALRAVLSEIARPTEEAVMFAQRMGISFGFASLKTKGLLGFMRDLSKQLKGDEEAWTKLFGNIRGLLGVMGLGGYKIEDFVKAVGEMEGAAGSTDEAYAEMEKTLSHQWQKFLTGLSQMTVDFGEEFRPLVKGIFEGINEEIGQKLDELTQDWGNTATNTEEKGLEIGRSIGKTITTIYGELEGFYKKVKGGIEKHSKEFKESFDNMTDAVIEISTFFQEHGPSIENTIGSIAKSIASATKTIKENAPNIAASLTTAAHAIKGLADGFKYLFDILSLWRKLGDVVGGSLYEFIEALTMPDLHQARLEQRGWPKGLGGPYEPVEEKQHGGYITGRGGIDKIAARLTAGEFVMNAAATKVLRPLLEDWNKRITPQSPYFNKAEFIGDLPSRLTKEMAGMDSPTIDTLVPLLERWEKIGARPTPLLDESFVEKLSVKLGGEEFVKEPTISAATLQPLLDELRKEARTESPYYDQSSFTAHLSFTSPVDRETVRRFIVPELQRAWEIGTLKRSRSVR